MRLTDDLRAVLAMYPADCRPERIESLGGAGGFSGAQFWRLAAPRGRLCLRRWPAEHPDGQRLDFIHSVLRHVGQQGLQQVPVPLATIQGDSFVRHGGHLWELAPWLSGEANYHQTPSGVKLRAAMSILAEFHQAATSLPHSESPFGNSPGIAARTAQLASLVQHGHRRLVELVGGGDWPEMEQLGRRILDLFPAAAPPISQRLTAAGQLRVPLTPCLRDIWHDHVLFTADQVTGLIDFGALRIESVSGDIARLLGSLAGDDRPAWETGLAAYQTVRPLSAQEQALIATFDQSTVLISGMNWLTWKYIEGRKFDYPEKVIARLSETLLRLEHLV